jgi:hypothetical protein
MKRQRGVVVRGLMCRVLWPTRGIGALWGEMNSHDELFLI